jgi:hypothetical protein
MHALTLASAIIVSVLGSAFAAPPCTANRPVPICARYITPYADNAYSWQSCGVSVAPNVLIGENVEFYDAQYGWYVPSAARPPR